MDDSILVKIMKADKEAMKKSAMKHGYMNLSEFIRDKMSGKLDSDELSTLKTQNSKLMKLLKDQEG